MVTGICSLGSRGCPPIPEPKVSKRGAAVSVAAVIQGTRAAIEADPANAAALFKIDGELVGTTEVDIRAGGHQFKVDEPAVLAGGDVAANPVQLALAALGSCQAITYRFWAEHLGIQLDGLSVEVEGDLDLRGFFGVDDSVRPGFGAVRIVVSPRGPESDERYQELARAVDEHCPVFDLFANSVPIARELKLG
jgi:uncharacterized OsmC-like protein